MTESLFDTLLEPVFILDKDLVVLYCNETASQLTDLSPRKITRAKKKIFDLFTFSEPIEFLDTIVSIKDPSPYKEIKFSTATIPEGKVQLTLQPFSDSSWILFFRDVTLEERLQKKYRAELEQKEDVIADLQSARAQLEVYSKQLESLVEERTKEIVSLNRMMKALLDSLNQGFFVFNSEGTCLPIYSKACLEILESNPSERKIWDVLSLNTEKVKGFQNWMHTLFSEMLPFEDLAPLGPTNRTHSQKKEISIQYYPIRTQEGSIEAIACVASDITDLVEAKHQAEQDRAKVDSILKIIQHKKQVELFFSESLKDIKTLNQLISGSNPLTDYEIPLRILHTLKGGAASFSYADLKVLCHQTETFLANHKNILDSTNWNSFKSQIKEIEHCLAVIIENYQQMFGKIYSSNEEKISFDLMDLMKVINSTNSVELKKSLEDKYLFEPIHDHISHFQDIINSTANLLNKKIAPLKVTGDNIKVPKKRFDYLFQVLIHALRNSVDHGIETPEQRVSAKKQDSGHLQISFTVENSQLLITLEDDGQGINPNTIREKLKRENSPYVNLPDNEIIYRIFDSSFSTKTEVSEVSGRGVGMNAILAEVTALGGKIHIESKIGQFTKFLIQVPFESSQKIQKAA